MNALNLEQSLTQIAADNSFTTVSVGRMPVGNDVTWTAAVHWDGYARGGITCASGYSDDSIIDALRRAIAKANADRTPANDVPAMLPALEAEIAA
jgi:hypothetical protein